MDPASIQPVHVIGIDAGGTKTVCLLCDGDGRLVAETRGEGANLHSAGELAVEKVLHGLMERVLVERPSAPAAICLGIAGVDRQSDVGLINELMRRIGHKARIVVTNDALVALVAGVGEGPGIVVISGTGSIAYGRNGRNQAARAGGWGYVLGDEGSGYWIGRHALRAVVREADGRGRPTAITPHILGQLGLARPQELVHAVYDTDLKPPAIAALARCVQRARDEGDPVAKAILDDAARELAASAASVARRLGLEHEAFPFVLSGGMFHVLPWLVDDLSARLQQVAPRASVRVLDREPAWGAVELAVAAARGRVDLPVYVA